MSSVWVILKNRKIRTSLGKWNESFAEAEAAAK